MKRLRSSKCENLGGSGTRWNISVFLHFLICPARRDVAIGIVSDKAVAVGAKPDHNIQKDLKCFRRDLDHARASNGSIGVRLHEVGTDVFSTWPLGTAECEGSKNKLQDETARNPGTSHSLLASRYSLQRQLT